MSIHAYRLPSTDSTRSVSLEELTALGWKILPSQLSPQDLEQTARKLAQELGYPLTQEGSVAPYSLKDTATNSQQMGEYLAKLAQISFESGWAGTHEVLGTATGGARFDVEDAISKSWIRVELPSSGALVRVPAGAKVRVSFDEYNMNVFGVAFFKGVLADVKPIEAKDLENHSARKSYLRSIGQV
ncbi:hypothetical protein BT96DRAFT_1021174 [Gymnopus androsaceus JB14]|uniref:Uncharacterized protein n=1 Tax=Gymnopus androsaceus JB14 TaxID=1447944 RepID=A0A6A4HFV7_9AGAR|nr:hypothetical protein BT96DRAFT_1021174 [Gymnopus androsaceus JB14]